MRSFSEGTGDGLVGGVWALVGGGVELVVAADCGGDAWF